MNRSFPAVTTLIAAAPPALAASHSETADGPLLLALAALLLLLWLLQRFSGAIILRLFHAMPADATAHPDLHRLNKQLARRVGLQPPRLFLVQSDAANAFTTGRDGRDAAVALTHGLLRLLDRQELAAVLAHELAHLRQRKDAGPFSAAAITGSAALLAGVVRSALVFSAGRRGAAFALATAPLAAFAAALSRRAARSSREFAADALGARICGNPRWLANALRKIRAAEHPAAATTGLLSSHPEVGERIQRLEALAYGAYV